MDQEGARGRIARLAGDAIAKGDATGWFEDVYASALDDPSRIPWADMQPNPWLVEWLDQRAAVAPGTRAVIVGCGLGDDAVELARRGYEAVAFDVSQSAIDWCRRRFPDVAVEFRTADLFALPAPLEGAFDFVFEANTLQSLPEPIRPTAIAAVAGLVAPAGTALVVARSRETGEEVPGPPWPLSRDEMRGFEHAGLLCDSFDDFLDATVRRFRAEYLRPAV